MKRLLLSLILVTTGFNPGANAAEAKNFNSLSPASTKASESSNADEIINMISKAGIRSPMLSGAVRFLDERVEDNEIRLYSGNLNGYNLSLNHDITSAPSSEKLEFRAQPLGKKYSFSAGEKHLMFRYIVELN